MYIYYFYYEKLVLQTTNLCIIDKYEHAIMNIYSIRCGLQIYNHNSNIVGIDRNYDNIIPS